MESRNKIAKNLSLPFHNQSQSKEEKAMNNLSPLTHISLLRLLILSGSHDLDGPGHVKIGQLTSQFWMAVLTTWPPMSGLLCWAVSDLLGNRNLHLYELFSAYYEHLVGVIMKSLRIWERTRPWFRGSISSLDSASAHLSADLLQHCPN